MHEGLANTKIIKLVFGHVSHSALSLLGTLKKENVTERPLNESAMLLGQYTLRAAVHLLPRTDALEEAMVAAGLKNINKVCQQLLESSGYHLYGAQQACDAISERRWIGDATFGDMLAILRGAGIYEEAEADQTAPVIMQWARQMVRQLTTDPNSVLHRMAGGSSGSSGSDNMDMDFGNGGSEPGTPPRSATPRRRTPPSSANPPSH